MGEKSILFTPTRSVTKAPPPKALVQWAGMKRQRPPPSMEKDDFKGYALAKD
jgi:hypothetical protein